jgi:hypothetical protein
MTREWEILSPTAHIYKIPRAVSNHNPLILSTQQNASSKLRDFRFELALLKDPYFLFKVKNIWEWAKRDTNALNRVQFKLKKVNKFHKGWGFNRVGSYKQRKKPISEELLVIEQIEEKHSLDIDNIRKRCTLMAELLKMLEEDELHWFKRSHETWLLKVDNNTEFFIGWPMGEKGNKLYMCWKMVQTI